MTSTTTLGFFIVAFSSLFTIMNPFSTASVFEKIQKRKKQ